MEFFETLIYLANNIGFALGLNGSFITFFIVSQWKHFANFCVLYNPVSINVEMGLNLWREMIRMIRMAKETKVVCTLLARLKRCRHLTCSIVSLKLLISVRRNSGEKLINPCCKAAFIRRAATFFPLLILENWGMFTNL